MTIVDLMPRNKKTRVRHRVREHARRCHARGLESGPSSVIHFLSGARRKRGARDSGKAGGRAKLYVHGAGDRGGRKKRDTS